ncbi:MAG: hypothetical protein ABI648_04705 [Betaproteobacteria bacterium]
MAVLFTLVSALAAPVDLWRLSVQSRQGEPFRATATLASLPEEGITDECLSMGPESDAPGAELPFLDTAHLKLDATRSKVEIRTDTAVTSPGVELVLRVQCPGAALYARHFSALIPPAAGKADAGATIAPRSSAQTTKRSGFRLSLLRGDSVESIAAVLFPGHRGKQKALVEQVIAGNPHAFPGGRNREVAAGTVLWFPDLREIRKSAPAEPPTQANPAIAPRRGVAAVKPPAAPVEPAEVTPARPRNPITLRRALELGDKPGPQECKQLLQLCGGEPAAPATIPPALDAKTSAIASGVQELHLKQEGIEQQLQRLEHSLQTLQMAVNSAPALSPPPPAPPPKVEIRTVVKSEPVAWYVWLGLAGLVLAAAFGGFAYGRRNSYTRDLSETDEQLDRMLATAATVMRELDSTPKSAPAPRGVAPPLRPAPKPATVAEPLPEAEPEAGVKLAADDQALAPASDVDVELESSAPVEGSVTGLSNDVLFEMDQALDNTRSMFTDVDRFIALGRTQNALSLLQFQVHKDPKDRDSWIKLMAIYRQEKMDTELAKAVLEFRNNFPHENPPAV